MEIDQIKSVYLAPTHRISELEQEFRSSLIGTHDRLVFSSKPPERSVWAQNIWLEPQVHTIESINHAAKTLIPLNRKWGLFSIGHHRRAALIQQKIDSHPLPPAAFPSQWPSMGFGSWTMIDPNTVIASPRCSVPFPQGKVQFLEDQKSPPSRAYLKLWEAFWRLGDWPEVGQTCFDAGSSPGSWTWVMTSLGANVVSVDRSPLDARISSNPLVQFHEGDAFQFKPGSTQFSTRVDWLCSDVICYPEKLLEWITQWLELTQPPNFVCTVKLKEGRDAQAVLEELKKIPHSRLLKLYANKNELTWIRHPKINQQFGLKSDPEQI